MSWYVENLLLNRESLRASAMKHRHGVVYVDLTGNDYNNLLLLEKTIANLHESGHITDREIKVINLISTKKPLRELEKENKPARHSLAKIFFNVCKKLAFILGGEFTDEGYLEYIQRKYKLNNKQVEQARMYMEQSSLFQT
jgi:hypothetical protein